jgi:plastocyanin
MRVRKLSLVAGATVILMVSLAFVLMPIVSAAQSTVVVSIPKGAGAGASGAPGYAPDKVTVVIGVNNTVMWQNNDTAPHTVTPSVTPSSGSWPTAGSGNMKAGDTYSYTFTVPGNYTYICTYHSWMIGYVVVKAATTSTTTTTATTPEFPTFALGAILFVIMAALVLLAPRLRTSSQPKSGPIP